MRGLPGRDTTEAHRASTPLELFVDLCFVVAVAQAAAGLHHALTEDDTTHAFIAYPMVFFAIWWAWMNFTWFASAYDADTVIYRLAVFVQVAGILILAAGVPRAFDDNDLGVVILGYVVMRMGLVFLWLMASRGHRERHGTNVRYAIGVATVQVGWVLILTVPESKRAPVFLFLVLCDLAVPIWAERQGSTPWHPHHIVERYGLFTIIVLGESILATSLAVQQSLDAGDDARTIVPVAVGALVTVCSMWWIYFSQPAAAVIDHARESSDRGPSRDPYIWGYGHYVIFASAAAVGAGFATAVDQAMHHAELPAREVSLVVAVPIALFLLSVWLLHLRRWGDDPIKASAPPIAAALILLAGALGAHVALLGALTAALVTFLEVRRYYVTERGDAPVRPDRFSPT